MKKKYLIVGCNEDNHNVIDFYMDVVETAFKRKGYEVRYFSNNEKCELDKTTPVFVVTPMELVRWRLKGFKNTILWCQGIIPEESRLRHNSILRYYVLSLIEWFALKSCKVSLLVSHFQCEYYENKYHINLKEKSYFMPCYNCEIEESSFNIPGKYKNNVFCYVGSLAKWQCFEETVSFYKRIQERLPNAVLKILTPEVDKANKILTDNGIFNVVVKFVRQDQISQELNECKFGFIIREDIPINNVATPTKLSTYLSNGMIPIVSDCIQEFKLMLNDLHFKVLLDKKQDIKDVLSLTQVDIDSNDVYSEYKGFFEHYYNTSMHIENLIDHIKRIMPL